MVRSGLRHIRRALVCCFQLLGHAILLNFEALKNIRGYDVSLQVKPIFHCGVSQSIAAEPWIDNELPQAIF
jgi:hypothetical protein